MRLFDVGVVSLPSLSRHVAVTVSVCDVPQKYASKVHSYGVAPTVCGTVQVVALTSPCPLSTRIGTRSSG